MPPQAGLPLRDGRLGSSPLLSSSRSNIEPYYSNSDIELLHEIVHAAESIYPSLPERDRLPTNALFQAAEQVLPSHGYDPEQAPPNISRLIFKIGGQRVEGSLMDKFRSVLESMGIQVEYVQYDQSEKAASAASASPQSSNATLDQTGTFPISHWYHGRRRRNSDASLPSAPPSEQRTLPRLGRARSVSFTGSQRPAATREEQIGNPEGWRYESDASEAAVQASGLDPFNRVSRPPYLRRPGSGMAAEGYSGESDIARGYAVSDDEPSVDSGRLQSFARHSGHFSAPIRPEDASDRYLGASDTSVQTSDDRLFYPMLDVQEQAEMEGRVQALQKKHDELRSASALQDWYQLAVETVERNTYSEIAASRIDRKEMLSEVIDIWRENAQASVEEHLSKGPHYDAAQQAKMGQRIDRAYKVLLMFKCFTHWHACSQEEVERTAVARRHILRRRLFDAWRAHHAAEELKLRTFRLRGILRHWSRASVHSEAHAQVAVQRSQHDALKTAWGTWRREHSLRMADYLRGCRLKEYCLTNWQLKTQEAVALWAASTAYDQTLLLEDTVATWRAEHNDGRAVTEACIRQKEVLDTRRLLQDWHTHAALSKLLRTVTSAKERQIKVAVLDVWSAGCAVVKATALQAERPLLQDLMLHWQNECKLVQHQGRLHQLQQEEVLEQWRLELKLLHFTRASAVKMETKALSRLRLAASDLRRRSATGAEASDKFATRHDQTSSVAVWRDRARCSVAREHHAADFSSGSLASSCLSLWSTRAAKTSARTVRKYSAASKAAYYCSATNALSDWAEIAARTRRERLTSAYHTFRRRCKVSLASKCVSQWCTTTKANVAISTAADTVRLARRNRELAEALQHWETSSERMQVVQAIAAGAELEVWWGRWSSRAAELQDGAQDAAEHHTVQLVSRCVRAWEFGALQHKGRQHTVATVQEKNEKRLYRQVLAQWSALAVPDGPFHQDLRSSAASRRSLRHATQLSSRPAAQTTPAIDDGDKLYGRLFGNVRNREQQQPALPRAGAAQLFSSLPHRPARSAAPAAERWGAASAGQLLSARANSPSLSSFLHGSTGPPDGPPAAFMTEGDFDDGQSLFSSEADDAAAFKSTPVRSAAAAGRGATAASRAHRSTSTPSAILSTPHERALRQEYARAGRLSGSSLSVSSRPLPAQVRETPRVNFSDIKEESTEEQDSHHF